MAVTQWNPSHRATCKIRGIEPMVFASWYDLDQKFSLLRVFQKPHYYFSYGIQGGSFDLRTYTLDQFYHKHLLGWNTWSRSNEGFDLARYFGTKWTFYPHAHVPYVVFYERNWDTTEFEQLPKMHPFWLLIHRRNVKVVLPRTMHGRKRRLWIKPPSLQTSHWFYQSSWVGTALFRIGVTPLNVESPWIHKPGGETQPSYATWIGWGSPPTANQPKPLPVRWSGTTFSSLPTNMAKCMYRWWWDTGSDNYILINPQMTDPNNNGPMMTILPINYPYYVFFYGAMLPTGKDNVKADTQLPGKNPQIWGKQNPSPIALWWYYDPGVNWLPDTQTLHMDNRYLRPEDLPTPYQGRTWIWLNNTSPFPNSQIKDDTTLKTAWTTVEINPLIQALVQNSPFVVGKFDIPFNNREINITAKYTSVWQWGGTIPKPDHVVDPEQLQEQKPPQAQVRNPATVGYANLHPWDLSQRGSISDDKLRAILTDLLTPPGPRLPDTSRAASPSPRRRHRSPSQSSSRSSQDRSPPRKRRQKRRRMETPSESDESEGPPSSSESSERGTPRRETPETTESESDGGTPPRARVILRKHLQLHKR